MRRRINIASHKRGARASRAYTPHVCVSARVLRVRTCVRCRAHGYQVRGNGEASKSETKGAHTAFLDSIVIKRGATAARAGRCTTVVAVVVVVVVVVRRRCACSTTYAPRRTRDGTLRHSRTILAISAARYNDSASSVSNPCDCIYISTKNFSCPVSISAN